VLHLLLHDVLGSLQVQQIELCHTYRSNCNTVEWFWWDWSPSQRPSGFLQYFDTVDLVIWPVKIIGEMTCNVSSGTLNIYSLTW